MGKKKREAVRKWAAEHPAPPPLPAIPTIEDVERVEDYRRQVPFEVDELAASAVQILKAAERATKSGDPMDRDCFACGHPLKRHGQDATCECCAKGIRVVPPGTDLMRAALREREMR